MAVAHFEALTLDRIVACARDLRDTDCCRLIREFMDVFCAAPLLERCQFSSMRADMYKVIVERPRRGKRTRPLAIRFRNDLDSPAHLGMRAAYDHRELNENLNPLRRYLRTQVGRPWSKVFSEICATIDRRNTVQQHIHQHIDQFIATRVGLRDGRLIDFTNGRCLPLNGSQYQELYVDPRSGLIRLTNSDSNWKRERAERRHRHEADVAARRRVLDDHTLLLNVKDVWFRVEIATLPTAVVSGRSEARFDVVLGRFTAFRPDVDGGHRRHLYGSETHYAVSKRQSGKRELKACGLR
jgi:hypothetical protein